MVDTFLAAGLGNAVLATLLALVAAVVGRIVRRPALGRALWLLVLLKLVTPPFVPLPVPWPERTPEAIPAPVPTPEQVALYSPVTLGGPVVLEGALPLDDETGTPSQEVAAAPPPSGLALAWQHVILALWLAGALFWWGLTVSRHARFRWLLRYAVAADGLTQARAQQLAQRLGLRRCPPVLLLPAPVPPMLWAVLGTPRVLLPAELWQRLSEAQRDTLLAHELAHLRRGDAWVRRLELLALGLYWWHPVAWWCRRALAEAEEQCCDAWVVWALPGAAEAYAAALVETVAFLSRGRRALPAGASGIGHLPSLKRRLQMIVRESPPRQLSRVGVLAVCALGAVLLPLLPMPAGSAPQSGLPEDVFLQDAGPRAPQAPADDKQPSQRPADPGKDDPSREADQRLSRLRQLELIAYRQLQEDAANRKRQIEELTDEVELLQLQVRAREAELAAARAHLRAIETNIGRLQKAVTEGVVSREELLKAEVDKETALAQFTLKELAVREAMIRLRPTNRRLEALRQAEKAADGGEAAALFQTRGHDFGAVSGDKPVSWSAQLVNRTKNTYRISGVRVTDSAITATPRSVELRPGDEGTIAVWIDPARFTGAKMFRVWVHFSEPREEQISLDLKARRDPENRVMPPQTVEERRRELEKKLDRLLQEVEELRKELRPKKAVDKQPEDRR